MAPLLVNQRSSSGFMFRAVCGTQVVANGGRFDSLIKQCELKKKRKPMNISAVDVSFNVEAIVKSLMSQDENPRIIHLFSGSTLNICLNFATK